MCFEPSACILLDSPRERRAVGRWPPFPWKAPGGGRASEERLWDALGQITERPAFTVAVKTLAADFGWKV